MPTRDTPWPAGTPCWVDVAVPDLAAGKAFYGAVLGWTFMDTGEEFGHYNMCLAGDRSAAGLGPIMQEGQPAAWTVYLGSDDADATAKLIRDNGGAVIVEPMDIPNAGRMAIATDPTGAAFGVWQGDPHIGIGVYNEPGSLVWEDARLSDPAAGQAFYTAVFGYRYQPIPGAPDDYSTFGIGGDPLGGIGGLMGAPDDVPGHWLPYFGVADADAAVAAAQAGAGSVLMPAEDTPFGRIGVLVDPAGAVFGIHQELAQ